MRGKDRLRTAAIWVASTLVAFVILAVFGSVGWALLFLIVGFGGLVAFLRVTHPDGAAKPKTAVLYDERALQALRTPEQIEKVRAARAKQKADAEARAEQRRVAAEQREKERAERAEQERLAAEKRAEEAAKQAALDAEQRTKDEAERAEREQL